MPLKTTAGKIHLWLGFIAGLVVVISLTAASLFVWEEQLNEWYHHDKIFVPAIKSGRLPFEVILNSAKKASPGGYPVTFMYLKNDPSKAFVFTSFKPAKKKGWTWASGMDAYSKIFVDQYTGKVLGVVDLRYDWIFCTRMLHQCLLLNYDVGHYFVGGATLIIFIMIITGIILWWPKNKAALKQRVWFKWKSTTRWKRKNYDIHNIGGIYTFFFILIFAITGLVWTFDWWTNTIYRILGNDPKKVWSRAPKAIVSGDAVAGIYDSALTDVMHRIPAWQEIGMGISKENTDAISCNISYSSGTSGWDESDNYAYHPQTGKLYFTNTHDQKTTGAKWRNSNYAYHVGSIFGTPTKILASFIALFCASLPVSGFYIWWGRRRKTTKP